MQRILIIEDDPDIARLLALRLRASGYQPSIAGDAVTAMTVVQQEHPDLIVLDLGLPGGDGLLVLERLRAIQRLALLPVIVMTARDPDSTRERALEAGATDFFPKPLDMDALLTAIERQLGAAT
jgi:DNA-binding response OmpR family regulator